MSKYKYKYSFIFTEVTEDAREMIVNSFSNFDWEMGLDVNTETVAVLDYGFTDRKTAKAISEWSEEDAEAKALNNFANHVEQFSEILSKDKIKRLKELAKFDYLKGLFGEPQGLPTDMTEVMDGIASKKHKKDEFMAAFIIMCESNKPFKGVDHAEDDGESLEWALLGNGNFFYDVWTTLKDSNKKGGLFSKEIDNSVGETLFVNEGTKEVWSHDMGHSEATGNFNHCENTADDEIIFYGSTKGY